MSDILITCAIFAAGYVASVYTWPWIRLQANGAAAEATSLRTKAAALEAAIKGL